MQEAQDAFLEILSFNADDEDAMHGLVVARQSLTGNDPQLLRRHAAEYWSAIKRGADTKEHYTRRAMEQLVVADVRAAREIEARSAPASRGPGSAARPGPQAPTPEDTLPAGQLPPTAGPAAKPAGPQAPTPAVEKPRPSTAKPTGPQKPRTSGEKLASAPAPAAKPAAPQKPPSSAGKLQAPATPAAKPAEPQTPASAASGQKGAEVPPTSPVFQKLPGAPAASAVIPVTPQTAAPPPAQAQKGAEVPPTSPALQKIPAPPAAPPAKPAAPQTPPASSAPGQKGAEVPPTSPALQKIPAPPAAAPQTPSAPPDNRLYTVRVGPISDRDRAAAIARQLSARGFSQTRVATQTGFRVVSEPLPRSVAEGFVTILTGRGFHGQIEPLSGDTVQVLFGSFASQRDAEALSRRIAAAGYDAWVREGTVYTLQIGPYPQSSVTAITGIVKSGAPEAGVAADPVP